MRLRIRKNCFWKDITKKDYLSILLRSSSLGILTYVLFYRSPIGIVFLFPLYVLFLTKETEECLRKKKNAFNEQFKNAVAAIASGLSVGNSVENAVVSGEKELRLIYDSKERIIREFQIMIRQLKLHVSMEKIFEDLALRVPEEDVRDFVTVFVTVKKSGGNLVAIIADTARQISEKQEVEREIEILLAAKKYEFKIMTMVPFLIIGYMSLSFPEFMKPLYGNIFGVGVMTICLGIYTVAYYMGLKIIKIEV